MLTLEPADCARALSVTDLNLDAPFTDDQVEAEVLRSIQEHGGTAQCLDHQISQYLNLPTTAAKRMTKALKIVNGYFEHTAGARR